jgi:hypothetical protein
MTTEGKILLKLKLVFWTIVIAAFVAVLLLSPVWADYKLEVWERQVPLPEYPLAQKRLIAWSDCRREREWLLFVMHQVDRSVFITCDKL